MQLDRWKNEGRRTQPKPTQVNDFWEKQKSFPYIPFSQTPGNCLAYSFVLERG